MAGAVRTSAMLAVLLASVPVAASGTQASPVQKVISLIDEMAAKVTKEANEESKVFDEFAKYCDDESTAKEYAIGDGKEAIEELTATIEDAKATIETSDSIVSDVSAKISDTTGELTAASSMRAKDNESFKAVEKELLGTIDELETAVTMIQKSLALVQLQDGRMSAQDSETMNAVVQAIGQIVAASAVSQSQKDHIDALLQEHEDAEEDAELGGRTMNPNAILETLQEMQEKAEASLTETRKGETEATSSHQMLKQGLENEIASMNKEKSETTIRSASAAEELAQAEKDIAVEQSGLAEDVAYLKDLKRDCQSRAEEFEVEAKDNKAELTALGHAKAILEKKFASFVQTGAATRTRVAMRDDVDDDSKARALQSLAELGKQLHSTSLVALAYRAASDPFGKVRSMIEEMIANKLQEAAEEATQKAFCDTELGESKAMKKDKDGKLDKVNARLEKAESDTAGLTEAVASLSQQVAENDAAIKTATEQRLKEKADFAAVEKDLSESQEACAAAIEVLREYYEGASLLQVSARTRAKARSAEDAGGDGSGILGVLEVAEGDFADGLAEARNIEAASQAEYDKMLQDGKMLKATIEMEIKGKQSELASLKTSTTDLNEDKAGLSAELDAVHAYMDKLKPQCETSIESPEAKKAEREQEIEGLKNALDILGQGAPALAQTGFRLRGVQ